MRIPVRNLLLWGAISLNTSLWGQTSVPGRELDLGVTYTAEHSNLTTGSNFWRQGGGAEISAEIAHGLGLAVNVTGTHAGNILGTGIDLSTLTTTVGPRYTWHPRYERVSVFGQTLLGESHAWNSSFPQTGGATSSSDSFALQVGGGVDLRIGHHFAVRPIQADWERTQFPNATTTVQNNLRLGAGLVLRLFR